MIDRSQNHKISILEGAFKDNFVQSQKFLFCFTFSEFEEGTVYTNGNISACFGNTKL